MRKKSYDMNLVIIDVTPFFPLVFVLSKKPYSWIKPKGRAKSPLTGARHLSINGSYLICPIFG